MSDATNTVLDDLAMLLDLHPGVEHTQRYRIAELIAARFDVRRKPAISDQALGVMAFWAVGSDSFTQEHRGERLRLRLAEEGLHIVRKEVQS